MPKDLRTFIASLSEEQPNEIVRVTRPVDPAWESARSGSRSSTGSAITGAP